jgi:cyclic pyranopterin monophosphate synthase
MAGGLIEHEASFSKFLYNQKAAHGIAGYFQGSRLFNDNGNGVMWVKRHDHLKHADVFKVRKFTGKSHKMLAGDSRLHFQSESMDNADFNQELTAMSEITNPGQLTHLDAEGNARMVDVSEKPISNRVAVAAGEVLMQPATLALIASGGVSKGDVLAVARVAGIMAAKRCPELIPLCHPLLLNSVSVDFELDETAGRVLITARCGLDARTGVEMEALTAVSVAALTVYDMCKAADKNMIIGQIRLISKTGGKSGDYRRYKEIS